MVAQLAATSGHSESDYDFHTLVDLRELMRHLPKDHRAKSTWQHVAAELDKAAAGGDTADVSIALRIVLMLERVEYRG